MVFYLTYFLPHTEWGCTSFGCIYMKTQQAFATDRTMLLCILSHQQRHQQELPPLLQDLFVLDTAGLLPRLCLLLWFLHPDGGGHISHGEWTGEVGWAACTVLSVLPLVVVLPGEERVKEIHTPPTWLGSKGNLTLNLTLNVRCGSLGILIGSFTKVHSNIKYFLFSLS